MDLLQKVGERSVIRQARRLGIESPLTPHKSLALGGLRTGVYGVFANKGVRTNSVYIRRVVDREDNVIYRGYANKRSVLRPGPHF